MVLWLVSVMNLDVGGCNLFEQLPYYFLEWPEQNLKKLSRIDYLVREKKRSLFYELILLVAVLLLAHSALHSRNS